uniref:Phosphatidylinositol-glycan biosynthesis class X protein n=1 Tax=Anopheles maculatus TaxID=74869 RepID=A0A182SL76_9DIPT
MLQTRARIATVVLFVILPGIPGQFVINNGLPGGKGFISLESSDSGKMVEPPAVSPEAPCLVRTIVTPDTNASYIITDRIYDIQTLDQPSTTIVLPSILHPIKDYRCITVRVQSQLQPNTTEMVEGLLDIFCGLKLLVRFTFWVNQNTGCTELFLEDVRVDLERCGTIIPSMPETHYKLLIESYSKVVFRLGYDSSPALEESTLLPHHEVKSTGPPSIEDMWKCNCTLPRDAFKGLRLCVVGSINNITKLVIHISMIVSIGIGTTCTLMLIVWLIRKVWKFVDKL